MSESGFFFTRTLLVVVAGAIASLTGAPAATAQDNDTPASPVTTSDPTIPVNELELLLKPLTKDELEIEVHGWLQLLKAKVAQISETEIAVRRANRAISEAEQVAAEAEEAKQQTEDQGEQVAVEQAERAAAEQEQAAAQAASQAHAEAKQAALEELTKLREQRTALIDRLNTVLTEFEEKGGETDEYERYITAVSGVSLDVTEAISDASYVWTLTVGWLRSPEGGLRWVRNITLFLVTIIIFLIFSRIVGQATKKAVGITKGTSGLLRDFIVKSVRRTVFFIGFIVALSMLEVPIGPFLAAIGAAGLVIGLALQGTLSNFASGIMILLYRPFDVGDAVSVAGISGKVESMNLVSTNITTWDNQKMVVPNNEIWGNVITNITGNPTRRIDMVFGISYSDDIAKAQRILEEIIASHELVIEDPAPTIKLHELGDSSVNFVVRPWSKTADYWTVYWDITRTVKERFDAEGISIPFPQRDVHIHQVPAEATA